MKRNQSHVFFGIAVLAVAALFGSQALAEDKFIPPAPIGNVEAATATVGTAPPPPVGMGAIKPPKIVEPSAKDMPPVMPQIKMAPPPAVPEMPKVDGVHSDKAKQNVESTEKLKTKAVKEPASKVITKDAKPDSKEKTDSDESTDSDNKDKSPK